MTAPSSRLATARRRLRVARYGIAALAAAGFAGGIAAARASHAAVHHTTASSQAVQSDQSDQSGSFGFGSGSYIAPATSAPAVQSGGS
ncbi:MAG: hypothetical protein ACJ76I_01675 [Gaiellaceae bacterium]